jgi:hypothetical protein
MHQSISLKLVQQLHESHHQRAGFVQFYSLMDRPTASFMGAISTHSLTEGDTASIYQLDLFSFSFEENVNVGSKTI